MFSVCFSEVIEILYNKYTPIHIRNTFFCCVFFLFFFIWYMPLVSVAYSSCATKNKKKEPKTISVSFDAVEFILIFILSLHLNVSVRFFIVGILFYFTLFCCSVLVSFRSFSHFPNFYIILFFYHSMTKKSKRNFETKSYQKKEK